MKKILLATLTVLAISVCSKAQTIASTEPTSKSNNEKTTTTTSSSFTAVAFSGQVGFSYGSQSAFLNFGGPGLKFSFNKAISMGLNMAPSIRVRNETDLAITQAPYAVSLGIMPSISYKKFSMIVAFHMFKVDVLNAEGQTVKGADRLRPTFGLAYKFGK
jgi:hypothetical protein